MWRPWPRGVFGPGRAQASAPMSTPLTVSTKVSSLVGLIEYTDTLKVSVVIYFSRRALKDTMMNWPQGSARVYF